MTMPQEIDLEALLVAWLRTGFPEPDTIVTTETDDELEQQPQTLRIARAGGPSTFTLTRARMVIDSFAGGAATGRRQAARSLALEVDHVMRWQLRGVTLGGVAVITLVTVSSGPTFVPDPNTSLRHFAATYNVTARRVLTPPI